MKALINELDSIRSCSECGMKNKIIKTTYPVRDGYDHECSCAYCDNLFFMISGRSIDDYCAYKMKQE